MVTGRIKNWSKFQHYKDRAPPWIKLQRELLDDFDFACLPLASKALAPLLWLLASETKDGDVRVDPEWLAFRLRWPLDEARAGITPLIEKGFVIVASDMLAECLQDATPEGEGETEGETEITNPNGLVVPGEPGTRCPHAEIIALYHETLPSLPRVRDWTDARQGYLRKRWCEAKDRQSLDWWRDFFGYVGRSDFLMGRKCGRGGEPFQCDLEWLVRPRNFVKVIEGKYENREAA
jgi:hypothetical protein